jgi:hypothetical protein
MIFIGFDDVGGKFQHVLWDFFIRNIIEIFVLFADLVGIVQRNPEKALTARFERDDVLARGEDNPPESATIPSLRIASRITANAC